MKLIKKITLLSMLSLLVLTGCGKNTTKSADKTINMMEINEISAMDSAKALDGGSFIAITQVIEGLYNLDKNDNIIPGVAKALPKISDDGLTYTVDLRQNAHWSNGTKVTAHDFVYAWQKVVDPKTAAPSAFLLYDIKNAAAINQGKANVKTLGVEAVNDYQLKVTLAQPVAYFTSVMTFPTLFPQNEAYVKKQGKKYAQDSQHMIYNGPYKLADWQSSDQKWRYVKNNRYWHKQQSNVKVVNIQVVKDTNTAVNLFTNKQLDRAVLSGEYAKQYKNDKNYTTQLDSWTHLIELNQNTDSIFANPKARQAVNAAIDRQKITDKILNNDSQPIYGLIPAKFVKNPQTKEDFRQESGNIAKYDTKKATALWQEAIKETPNAKLELSLMAADQDENKAITEYLQNALEKQLPGLKLSIQLLPEKKLLDNQEKKQFDLLLTRKGPDFQDPTTFLNSYQSSDDTTNYHSETYDNLLKKAQSQSTQPTQRWQTLIAAEHQLINDAGVIPVYQSANTSLLRGNIHGMINHLFGPPNYYGKIQLK